MKIFRFIGRFFGMLAHGQFSLALYELIHRFPPSLIMFNRAVLLRSDTIDLPPVATVEQSRIKVWVATAEDIPEIVRIGGLATDHVRTMMESGAVCFLASLEDGRPLAYTWSAYYRCYIRGVGFEYDFEGKYDYSYFNLTLPEARGKGIYRAIKQVSARHADSMGINRFTALIEFTNEYSYKLHMKMGYQPFIRIVFLKLLGLRICRTFNLETDRRHTTFFVKEPQSNTVTI